MLQRLSQGDLASRAGVALSTISRIEKGHVDPSVATIRALATARQVCAAWLAGFTD